MNDELSGFLMDVDIDLRKFALSLAARNESLNTTMVLQAAKQYYAFLKKEQGE